MKKLIMMDPVQICGLNLIRSDIWNFRWEAQMYGIWHARVKQKIAALMEEVELLKQDRVTKQRYIHHFLITKSSFNVSLSPGKWPIIFHRDKQFAVCFLLPLSYDPLITVLDILLFAAPHSVHSDIYNTPYAANIIFILQSHPADGHWYVLEAHTTHNISHSMDPIPLRKQKAILQVQEEGLEDHEVVAIIEHFQSDVTIADSYLTIKKDSICKLFGWSIANSFHTHVLLSHRLF